MIQWTGLSVSMNFSCRFDGFLTVLNALLTLYFFSSSPEVPHNQLSQLRSEEGPDKAGNADFGYGNERSAPSLFEQAPIMQHTHSSCWLN